MATNEIQTHARTNRPGMSSNPICSCFADLSRGWYKLMTIGLLYSIVWRIKSFNKKAACLAVSNRNQTDASCIDACRVIWHMAPKENRNNID